MYNIVTRTVLDTYDSLYTLISLIEETNNGHLTTKILEPRTLRSSLRTIKGSLTDGSGLPYPVSSKTLPYYYRDMKPILTPDRSSFHITLIIPIVNENSQFDVYDMVNEPVYDPQTKLSAKLLLEANVIAISQSREHYLILSPSERVACADTPFCSVHSPIYSSLNSEICIMTLFKKDQAGIYKICKTQIVQPETIPHAHLLFGNHWLITTTVSMVMSKICGDDKQDFDIKQGQTIFDLEENCSLVSKYFSIPVRTMGMSELQTRFKFEYD